MLPTRAKDPGGSIAPARRLVQCAFLVIATCAWARMAAAQKPYKLGDGFGDSVQVAWADIGTRCVTVLRTGFVMPAADSSCRVVNLTLLGAAGGREWHVARYRRSAILPDSEFTDTLDLDELALFAHAPDADEARLIWHIVRDRDIAFLDTLQWVPTSHGPFLDLLTCLNGTGGCGDAYLRFDGDRWHAIAQPFARDLQARLPPDHWLHKGRRLDLETLTGVWPVSAPGDANCCPSLEIRFSVRLEGDAMVLRDAGPVRPVPQR